MEDHHAAKQACTTAASVPLPLTSGRASAAAAAAAAAQALPPIYELVGECWAAVGVFLDLRALSCLCCTSRALATTLAAAPLDCWMDMRCSARGQRSISAAGLQALRRIAGARLRTLDLHGCTQLQSATLPSAVLMSHNTVRGQVAAAPALAAASAPGAGTSKRTTTYAENLIALGFGDVRCALALLSSSPPPHLPPGTLAYMPISN